MSSRNRRRSGGGAATSGGMEFQHRVTAWVSVRILAEKDASPPWRYPASVVLKSISCETDQPLDDILVEITDSMFAFLQVKRNLQLSRKRDSDFASALRQCVRQYILCRQSSSLEHPWQRALDVNKDRLLIVVGPGSSAPIHNHLPNALHRLRTLSPKQPFEEAASNKQEQRALSLAVGLITHFWEEALGAPPSYDDLRQILTLIHIEVLDIENGGSSEREAKDLLRTAVLIDPGQVDAAWACLITFCQELATKREGTDRLGIQRTLIDKGIFVKAARSYRNDIERLMGQSQTTARLLSDLAHIRIGPSEVKVKRPSVDALRRAAEANSLLVVGEPGSGKSGALYDLFFALEAEKRDAIFLAVDRISARSFSLLRAEFGLEYDIPDLLENWPGKEPAFLIIDALDAARSESASRAIRDLIQMVTQYDGRWHIVASIRKFDVRYSQELRRIFSGEASPEFQDPEFRDIRHINIPYFSDEELAQIAPQSTTLHELVKNAKGELLDLIRVPFNLRILAELLETGLDPAELTPIRTQQELLDRYWVYRIIRQDGQGDDREAVLRKTCDAMAKSRSLRVSRSRIVESGASIFLTDLLSNHVLAEWQASSSSVPDRYTIIFSHHILFDYAAARLLLRDTGAAVVSRLEQDPDLVLVIRPSLILQFRHLWATNRGEYWNLTFLVIKSDRIPEIGKLIGPSVAVELAKEVADFEPIFDLIEKGDNGSAAEAFLRHLVGTLLVSSSIELVGQGAGPWCDLLERVSCRLTPSLAYLVRSLLSTICQNPEKFTDEQRSTAGKSARRLLEFAWDQKERDKWLIIHGIEFVCHTFESDPASSLALLRRSLEPEHLKKYGFEEIPWLTREIKRLIPLDLNFVEEVYRTAFSHKEESRESTPLGQSRILSMTSNRQQDYDMALYTLADIFPEFLAFDPVRAIGVLLSIMDIYVAQEHRPSEEHEETFAFDGIQGRILTDHSSIWDQGDIYSHDNPMKMLKTCEEYLQSLAEGGDNQLQIRNLITALIRGTRFALLWRRLLILGASFPDTIGKEIVPLAWATPVLLGFDTTYSAGDFLKAIFPKLDPIQREKIERTLLSIAGKQKRSRNRLLGCLNEASLVTDEAKAVLKEIKRKKSIPSNDEPYRIWSSTRPYTESDYLRDEGVPVDEEANRKIRELETPIKGFADKHLNSVPGVEEAQSIVPALRELHLALSNPKMESAHPKQRDHALGNLAAACNRIARIDGLSCQGDLGAFIRPLLLDLIKHPIPEPDPERESHFDEHISWGGPSARIEAAAGVILLARHIGCTSEELLEGVLTLSFDPVPAVRFQIAERLNFLAKTAPDLMWKIAENLCEKEMSRGVLQGLGDALTRLAGWEPNRIVRLTKRIHDRITEGPGANKVRAICINIFTSLYIWRDHPECHEIIRKLASDPSQSFDDAENILKNIPGALKYGRISPPDQREVSVRQRAFSILKSFLRSAREGLERLEAAHKETTFNEWAEPDQKNAQSFARIINTIGREIYFASGGNKDDMLIPERERFYHEAVPIIDELTGFGFPSLSHHLLETLEHFISLDPRGVFLRIGLVIKGGSKGGYQYESLAANLMVKLIERYLAEYRPLLRDDEECRKTLLEVLDIFVQAGWPRARRLAYRLEEIFR